MDTPATWVWVFIPVAAILVKGFRSWLQFQATQRQLGASTTELENEVAQLRRTNETFLERLQNLEAIVVSQTWDALHAPELTAAERDRKVASAVRREVKADPTAANQQRAEQLAQRLRG